MIGVGAMGEPPLQALRLAPGEALLLCSDGLHGFVAAEQFGATLQSGLRDGLPAQDLAKAVCVLIELSLAQGSQDDISALCVQRRLLPQL